MTIIGHQKQWQFLINSLESNKLSHAYLFSGQEKLGKKKLALEFVKWLFKEDIEKKQHPDFIFIEPLKKEIQISQMREFIWKLALKPSVASYKVAIIDQAHCLNEEAQNCLLKTLEEPKGQTILLLITQYPDLLLSTIISRCQIIKFYPLSKKEIEDYLKDKNLTEENRKEILEICQGSPGKAIDILKDLSKLEIKRKKEEEIKEILDADLTLRFQYAKIIFQTNNIQDTLNNWLVYFRKILLSKLKKGQKILASDISRLKQIQKTNYLIATSNINPKLGLEILMLEL